MKFKNKVRSILVAAGLMAAVSLGVGSGAAAGAPSETKPASATHASKVDNSEYVGSEVCLTCHQDQDRRFKNTVMGKIFAHPRTDLE